MRRSQALIARHAEKRTPRGLGVRRCLAILLFVLTASSAGAATVRGSIVHQSGQPGRYIAVRVAPAQGEPSAFVYSGGDGWYYLNGVAPGNYTLEVWVSEKEVVRTAISVQEPATEAPKVQIP